MEKVSMVLVILAMVLVAVVFAFILKLALKVIRAAYRISMVLAFMVKLAVFALIIGSLFFDVKIAPIVNMVFSGFAKISAATGLGINLNYFTGASVLVKAIAVAVFYFKVTNIKKTAKRTVVAQVAGFAFK